MTYGQQQRRCLCAGKAREKACLQTLTVLHVPGDPLQKDDLDTKLDMQRFHTAMLCRTSCIRRHASSSDSTPSPLCVSCIHAHTSTSDVCMGTPMCTCAYLCFGCVHISVPLQPHTCLHPSFSCLHMHTSASAAHTLTALLQSYTYLPLQIMRVRTSASAAYTSSSLLQLVLTDHMVNSVSALAPDTRLVNLAG